MHPVAALNEIAFWLERELAPTFKVKAFRSAAEIVGSLSTDEIAARAADGRLTKTKGIGARTFEVISQAVDGAVPDYLENLRTTGAKPLADGGTDLLAQLRGDLHSHSEWSDGGSTIEQMVAAARSLGREYLALTDHSPSLKVASGLTAERLAEQLDVIDGLATGGAGSSDGDGDTGEGDASDGDAGAAGDFRLLTGIEVDILEDGTLDQTREMLDRLDIVVASVHSKLRADSATMTERMLGGIRDPHTTVLGHCTGRLLSGSRGTRPPSDFDAEAVFAACAEHDVAVEINSRPERQDPPDDLITLALDAGCLFSIDTDAHAPGQLDFLAYGAERADRAGVPVDRIITSWPVERLLEWAGRRR
ncbi:PHP domain-containing protein [Marisediminicola senii]|uniref:PHP domain-containing protein n=1 Tax=Marisediminicola senii TaxID=2711233 RepID=UPI0013ED89D4|nr:PHP domain-containing protein [Marisediminicola senii]